MFVNKERESKVIICKGGSNWKIEINPIKQPVINM
jgi:hypothetical protein